MNSDRIRAILIDPDFVAFFDSYRNSLTKRVMSRAATHEDRERDLAEYHAAERMLNRMRAVAQNLEE